MPAVLFGTVLLRSVQQEVNWEPLGISPAQFVPLALHQDVSYETSKRKSAHRLFKTH